MISRLSRRSRSPSTHRDYGLLLRGRCSQSAAASRRERGKWRDLRVVTSPFHCDRTTGISPASTRWRQMAGEEGWAHEPWCALEPRPITNVKSQPRRAIAPPKTEPRIAVPSRVETGALMKIKSTVKAGGRRFAG